MLETAHENQPMPDVSAFLCLKNGCFDRLLDNKSMSLNLRNKRQIAIARFLDIIGGYPDNVRLVNYKL